MGIHDLEGEPFDIEDPVWWREFIPSVAYREGLGDDVAEAFGSLEEFWEVLFPTEKQRIVQTLVERITVWPDGLDLKLKAVGVAGLVVDLNAYADEARQRGGQS